MYKVHFILLSAAQKCTVHLMLNGQRRLWRLAALGVSPMRCITRSYFITPLLKTLLSMKIATGSLFQISSVG